MRFIITSHGHLPGVRLTIIGDRCNLPFPDEQAARDECAKLAKGKPHSIERGHLPALHRYRSEIDARK